MVRLHLEEMKEKKEQNGDNHITKVINCCDAILHPFFHIALSVLLMHRDLLSITVPKIHH